MSSHRTACIWILIVWVSAALPLASGAETGDTPDPAPAPPPSPVANHQFDGPADPLDRGTPRGAMEGFLQAARSGDYERAAEYLDLRRLPQTERGRGPELARWLKEVLDQKLWVDTVNLAHRNAGIADDGLPAWQDRVGEIRTSDGERIPILLQRVPREGDRVRIWKVSAATVEEIPELYARFEPYWLETHLPPFFFEHSFLGISAWKWVALALLTMAASLLALLVAGTITRLIGSVFTRGDASFDVRIVRHVGGPVRLFWTVIFFALGHRSLGLSLEFLATLRVVERLLLVVAVAWLIFRLIDLAALSLRVRAERRGNRSILPTLVPGARFAKIVVIAIGVLGVLGTLGVNISAAVAGLGVGGIAVALAAQKSLENLLGGLNLFADRPVEVGDFCRYGEQTGTVEEIGLRSTRIRTLDRTVVSIPNSEFANLRLENFARRDRMRLHTLIGVRYETTPEQLRFLLARLRHVLLAHPRITPDPARVRFVGFGASSLDLEVFAYADTSDWNEFLSIREDVYLHFMDAVKEAGTGFAFPSTTTYVTRDDGLAQDEIDAAERRVALWREEGALPFPGFSDAFTQETRDTLPWPPRGSSAAGADGAPDARTAK